MDERTDPADEQPAGDLGPLIEHIRTSRGVDFSGYKPTTVGRRVAKRMQEVGCRTVGEYQDHLEVHPEEFAALFNTVLINVTSFLRDRPAWDLLRDEIVGRIISGKGPTDPIRVWSAGCASGEEAFSLAMVLADALGIDDFRNRVKIYGTDLDEDALGRARRGLYDARALGDLPADYLERFFDEAEGGFAFRADLRRSVIFGRHDLLQDAPISRLDLLACRNTLMYFNADAQAHVLRKFDFALRDGGFLFLGKAETLLAHAPQFSPVDLRMRIFTKRATARGGTSGRAAQLVAEDAGAVTLRDAGLLAAPLPTVLVGVEGHVVLVNDAAQRFLGISRAEPRGEVLQLELSHRPVDLRPLLEEAYERRATVQRDEVEWRTPSGDRGIVDVTVTPLVGGRGQLLGAAVTFQDATGRRELREELERTRRELASAYEELRSTNEELETTNEELETTVEELETSNEELQSANEELETTNEELHSTNDQLHALNEELQVRGAELDRVNAYLGTILTGLRWAVVVLDRDLLVSLWNHWAEDLWGLRSDEVRGRSLPTVEIGMPLEGVIPAIRACLDGTSDVEEVRVLGRNRHGQLRRCRVVCTPLRAPSRIEGVIVATEELPDAVAAPPSGPGG